MNEIERFVKQIYPTKCCMKGITEKRRNGESDKRSATELPDTRDKSCGHAVETEVQRNRGFFGKTL